MEFKLKVILDVKATLELDAEVADALTRLAGFSHESIVDELGKHFSMDFEKGGKHRAALLRFFAEIKEPALMARRQYYAAKKAVEAVIE